jgi:outer membrane immunogenic protein
MKQLSLGSVVLAALVGSAGAADLGARPPIAPVFSWSGCYIGDYLGGAWNDGNAAFTEIGNSRFASYSGGVTAARVLGPHSWGADLGGSFIGGGTLGCQLQPVGSPYVLGVEGEGGVIQLRGQAFDPVTVQGTGQTTPDVLGRAKVGDWSAMITGRLGYAWDRYLLYVKGGAAFVASGASVLDQCNTTATGCGNWLISTSGNTNTTTWTVGGGLEWAFAPSWSVKGEYMFIGLGLADNGFTTCASAVAPSGNAVRGGPFCFNHTFGGIHTTKIGLNYRFSTTSY